MTENAAPPSGRPLVIVVLPRIVELVVQQDRALTPALFSHRRRSYALRRERLLEIVDVDELGLDERVSLPSEVVLVAQERQIRLGGRALSHGLRTWRLAFAALAVLRLSEASARGALSLARVHGRIDRIGRDAFAEIESVLAREGRLFDEDGLVRIYSEFLVLHAELEAFVSAAGALDTYFPSMAGRQGEMADLVAQDLNPREILMAVKPEGVELPIPSSVGGDQGEADEDDSFEKPLPPLRPHSKKYQRLVGWASAALSRGNAVLGAILYRRASRFAPDQARTAEAEEKAHEVIDQLVERLRRGLASPDGQVESWRQALTDLFDQSSRGFWNTNKRLLHDLQKVCVDCEEERLGLDLFGFLRSFGRRPLRRPLVNQREVLMAKHLRAAASRVTKARLTSRQRATLSNLLRDAAASAESQLRERLRPRIARSLNEQGLRPENLPERVAHAKMVEELLDGIVRKGHLTIGDVRDAVSRSQLKLSDLTVGELWWGDAILRADRRLTRLLHGVYRRGDFYLRGLQRLSSLFFGRPSGRFFIEYAAVPFGGAYLIIKAGHIVREKLSGKGGEEGVDPSWLARSTEIPEGLWEALRVPESWRFDAFPNMVPGVLVMGFFLMGLLHSPGFRSFVWAVTQTVFRVLKHVVVDFPRWIVGLEWARWILRSRLAKVLRRYLIAPLIPTIVLYAVVSVLFDFGRFTAIGVFLLIFGALDYVLNSRVGRRFEERVGAWVGRFWYRFHVQFIRSLFESVMALFRRFLEITERLIYAIDEWLLFRRGENRLSLFVKGILGTLWSVVAYGIRFCVTLLIEPQINPIKHFPVVTVSHKILLPSQPFLANWMAPAIGNPMAYTVAGAVVFVLPGVAGFLVWELKSNWRLYRANRDVALQPVAVGSHGESLAGLLKPGFHSGLVGKLHARKRRAVQQSDPHRRRRLLGKPQERLLQLDLAVKRHVERELFGLLQEARVLGGRVLKVSDVELLPSGIHLRLVAGRDLAPLHLHFLTERDWLGVKVVDPGWLRELEPEGQAAVAKALAGFYKLSGVGLVDEQVRRVLDIPGLVYHLRWSELEVWGEKNRDATVTYGLRTWGTVRPHPSGCAKALGFRPVNRKQLLFGERDLPWEDWVRFWSGESLRAASANPVLASAEELIPVSGERAAPKVESV